ncbi:peptidylprolyl isomerase [Echinicola rosea]|uniref:Peptidyl-prolyl cis-trans isomerase n=1 Tax=Echinicola rosea TaxID=1807691 RepID=A0ABQ1UU80_9BACT|nr:peptidylprolyl isomerase [Echinicola rosea]GGF25181.1 hypothetical protein GCM10011339_11630 [Echinicola rosea]
MKSGIIILSLLIWVSTACDREHDKVLLQIGSYTLTANEYEYIRKNEKYSKLSTEQLHERLLEEGLILAYALDHQYDTIKKIAKQLEYIQRFYASTVDGYVWNKKVKPHLKVDEEALQKAYKRRGSVYDIEVVFIPTRETLLEYHDPEVKVNTIEGFNSLKQEVVGDERVKTYSYPSHYPFNPIGVYLENLDQLNIGDVIGPLETLKGFFIAHITNAKREIQRPYEQEKSIIEQELIQGLKEKYIWESQQQIFNETKPNMHEQAIKDMVYRFDPDKKDWPGVDLEMILMDYHFNEEKLTYSVRNFIEFVRNQPMFIGKLSDPNDMIIMMKDFLVGKYLHYEAIDMGMEKDLDYIHWNNLRKREVLIHHFNAEKVLPDLNPSEKELEEYYKNNISDFRSFKEASIVTYKYSSFDEAFKSRPFLVSDDQIEIRTNKKSVEGEVNRIIVSKGDINLTILETIMGLEINEMSNPVKVGEDFWLVKLLAKSGEGEIPYALVRVRVRQAVLNKMEKEIYDKHISLLKTHYPIKVDLLDTWDSKI